MTGIPRSYELLTVAAGDTTSSVCDCTRYQLLGISTPDELDSTAVTLEASFDGTTWLTVRQVGGGANESPAVAASKFIPLDPRVMSCIQYVRLVCGTEETADRQFVGVLRPVS